MRHINRIATKLDEKEKGFATDDEVWHWLVIRIDDDDNADDGNGALSPAEEENTSVKFVAASSMSGGAHRAVEIRNYDDDDDDDGADDDNGALPDAKEEGTSAAFATVASASGGTDRAIGSLFDDEDDDDDDDSGCISLIVLRLR